MAWQAYIPHAAGGAGGTGLVLYMFKDTINKWLEDKRRERAQAREDRAKEQGRGSNLENQLLSILKEDLAGNKNLLSRLLDTMSDFRDIAKRQAALSEETLLLARETRESQKWIERQFGGGPRS